MNIGKKATEAAPETGNKNNTKNHGDYIQLCTIYIKQKPDND